MARVNILLLLPLDVSTIPLYHKRSQGYLFYGTKTQNQVCFFAISYSIYASIEIGNIDQSESVIDYHNGYFRIDRENRVASLSLPSFLNNNSNTNSVAFFSS